MKKSTYCQLISAALTFAGIGFGIAGFRANPFGSISESVLVMVGQCFVVAGSYVGIESIILKNKQE